MQVVAQKAAKRIENGESCIAFEYPLETERLNMALVEIGGRYPESGRVMNSACEELAFCIDGEGSLFVDGVEGHVSIGAMMRIPQDQPFYWEGSMRLLVACAPSWSPEQYVQLPD